MRLSELRGSVMDRASCEGGDKCASCREMRRVLASLLVVADRAIKWRDANNGFSARCNLREALEDWGE